MNTTTPTAPYHMIVGDNIAVLADNEAAAGTGGLNLAAEEVVPLGDGDDVDADRAVHIGLINLRICQAGGTSVEVTLNNGKTYPAQIVGGDPDYDIAVIKVDPGEDELQPVVLGSSSGLQVGPHWPDKSADMSGGPCR